MQAARGIMHAQRCHVLPMFSSPCQGVPSLPSPVEGVGGGRHLGGVEAQLLAQPLHHAAPACERSWSAVAAVAERTK